MRNGDEVQRAFKGEGPLFDAMLDERARDLAQAPERIADQAEGMRVLVMAGAQGRWALPLIEVARVETLQRPLPVPDLPSPLMGLVLLAGQRYLLADLDALAAETPLRDLGRPGHAVLLRHLPLALAIDRADAIVSMSVPSAMAAASLCRGLLADGTVLLDVGRLAVKAKVKGGDG